MDKFLEKTPSEQISDHAVLRCLEKGEKFCAPSIETISVGRCVGAPGETGFEGEILRSKEHFYTEQEH